MIYTYNNVKFDTKNIKGKPAILFTDKNYFSENGYIINYVEVRYTGRVFFSITESAYCCGLDEMGGFCFDKKTTVEEIAFILDQFAKATKGIAYFFTISLEESDKRLIQATKFLRRFKKVSQFINVRTGHTIITFHTK